MKSKKHRTAKNVTTIYVVLTLLTTLSASFIWGVNTLFLLDAGLSNTEAFTANAFFTAGMVLFEVPTGVVADTWGRRMSFLIGTITLLFSTLFYLYLWYIQGAFYLWAISSMIIGLGFTFFSGAVEAWIVDALHNKGFKGSLESVFAKGQIASGLAMLIGSVAGGVMAQYTNLGVPFILRMIMLVLTFLVAFIFMEDWGFTPKKVSQPYKEMSKIFKASIEHGWKNRPVRWLIQAAPFTFGIGIFAFYAMQPYLLELYGDAKAYSIAGLTAAIVAGAQMVGGIIVPYVRKLFRLRTTILAISIVINAVVLILIGHTDHFYIAIALLIVWGMVYSLVMPVRQAYLNELIPSEQRATVLSFDSLVGSSGAVFTQPALGKAADVYSYSTAYLISGAVQLFALPFTLLARKEKASSDNIVT
ncbi:MAG: MFS transporter [Leptospirales bacterium]